jgi:hypothetical protein
MGETNSKNRTSERCMHGFHQNITREHTACVVIDRLVLLTSQIHVFAARLCHHCRVPSDLGIPVRVCKAR